MPKKLMDDCTEPDLKYRMGASLRWLENFFPAGDGPRGNALIVLLASGTFAGGVAQHAANAERADVIRFFRETADRLENRQDVPR